MYYIFTRPRLNTRYWCKQCRIYEY
ncbi:hypothetical protein MACK_003913 [Theileria orientalis]|uniref:Uncharacterized protein n=1 Tax=Theileria orientalis TaxID=68886 RepID=A0A976XJE2_THEOR|nr:hypothetical protein MACK_003913 [Theileria orientalis]